MPPTMENRSVPQADIVEMGKLRDKLKKMLQRIERMIDSLKSLRDDLVASNPQELQPNLSVVPVLPNIKYEPENDQETQPNPLVEPDVPQDNKEEEESP